MTKQMSPTQEFYGLLETAYDVFNKCLFDGKLTNCLLTVQREKKTMGYFSAHRWVNQKGEKTHEIALNPSYFGTHKVVEIFQTLVHEQCHLWQFEHGKPSRRTYHNKEWADKMESIGLMPSHTGLPGGNKTGQKMDDYPIENGLFLDVCKELIFKGMTITWFDRYVNSNKLEPPDTRLEYVGNDSEKPSIELEVLFTPVKELIDNDVFEQEEESIFQIAARTPSKIKYSCRCKTNVWGKPDLVIICGKCNTSFEASKYV